MGGGGGMGGGGMGGGGMGEVGLSGLQRVEAGGGEAAGAAGLRRLDFVVSSDATWEAFTRRAEAIFGRADESAADPAVEHMYAGMLQWSGGGGADLSRAPTEVVHVPPVQDAQRSRNARRREERRDSARAVRAAQGLTRTRVSVPSVSERTANRPEVTL